LIKRKNILQGLVLKINQPEHLAQLDGYSQKKGISGAYKADAFKKALVDNNVELFLKLQQESKVLLRFSMKSPKKMLLGIRLVIIKEIDPSHLRKPFMILKYLQMRKCCNLVKRQRQVIMPMQ